MEKYNILKDWLVCLLVAFQLRRKILCHGRSMMDHVCAEGSLPAIQNNPTSPLAFSFAIMLTFLSNT